MQIRFIDGTTLYRQHHFQLPLDHTQPNAKQITVFARELVALAKDKQDLPWLVFFQGGHWGPIKQQCVKFNEGLLRRTDFCFFVVGGDVRKRFPPRELAKGDPSKLFVCKCNIGILDA